jgi:hypothetical protein
MSEPEQKRTFFGQSSPARFATLTRRTKGTPKLLPVEDEFVCGYCMNTGWAERGARFEGERWIHCPCGLPQVNP